MRTLGLLGLVLGLLALTAVASPWVTWALAAAVGRPYTFARVYNRVFEVLLIVGLVLAWRRLDLGGLGDLGLRRARWLAELGTGLGAGLLGVGVALAVAGALGAVAPALRFAAMKTLGKAALGALAAILVGVGEETLFRGVLLRRLTRDAGVSVGVAVTTAIYAAVHAIGRGEHAATLDAWSGVERTAALLAPLGAAGTVPGIAGLALLGLLLALVRLRTGSLWVPIGIHAAWVATFRVGRLFFTVRPGPVWLVGPGWPPLVGGAAGWLAVAITAAVLLGLRRAPAVEGERVAPP